MNYKNMYNVIKLWKTLIQKWNQPCDIDSVESMLGRLSDTTWDTASWTRDSDGWIEDSSWISSFFFAGVYRKFMYVV